MTPTDSHHSSSVNIPGRLFLRWGPRHLCTWFWGCTLHSHTRGPWWSCRWRSSCVGGGGQKSLIARTTQNLLPWHLNVDDFPFVSEYLIISRSLLCVCRRDQMCFELMWNNRWRCHSLAFWCHSVGSYCYLCSPTPFSKFICPPRLYTFWSAPTSCLSPPNRPISGIPPF